MTRNRARNRRGFTVVELVIVVVLVGIVASITASGYVRNRQHVQNAIAQRYIATYAVSARAEAMQRGRTASLRMQGDSVWVTGDSAGTVLLLRPPVRLSENFGVRATATNTLVSFDPRGFAPALTVAGARYVVVPSSRATARVSDTVCVSRTGQIRTRGCA